MNEQTPQLTISAVRTQREPDNAKKLADFLAILHRGGSWWYTWARHTTQAGGTSYWVAVGEPLPVLRTGVKHINTYYSVHPLSEVPTTNKAGEQTEAHHLRGRIEHVASINCLFGDFDAKDFGGDLGATLTYIQAIEPKASAIVATGNGYHAYWLLDAPLMLDQGNNRALAGHLQREWVRFVGSDPGAKDLVRVLRVPGTDNWKDGTGKQVYFVECDLTRQYPLDQLASLLPPLPTKVTAPRRVITNLPRELAQAKAALSMLNPERRDNYGQWVEIGMALASLGETGLELWREWSQESPKYQDGDCESKWPTFTPGEDAPDGMVAVTLGTLHYNAAADYETNPNRFTVLDDLLGKIRAPDTGEVQKYELAEQLARELMNHPRTTQIGYRQKAKQAGVTKAIFDELADGVRDEVVSGLKEDESMHRLITEIWLRNYPNTVRSVEDWYRYDEGIWSVVEDEQIIDELIEVTDNAGIETSAPNIRGALFLAKARVRHVDGNAWNPNPATLVVGNGTVDVDARGVPHYRRHSPDDLARVRLDFDYVEGARCPTYERVLKDNLRDPAVIRFWIQVCGLTLVEDGSFEVSVWLKGPAGGGKSTVLEGLAAVLGGYSGHLSFRQIENNSFGLEGIVDKKLLYATEVSSKFIGSGSVANMLISQEMIAINRKYKPVFMYRPRCLLMYALNDMPATGSAHDGIHRRVKPIHVDTRPDSSRDPALRAAITSSAAERSGMFNLFLEGLAQVRATGRLEIPQSVAAEANDWQTENDRVKMFLDARCTVHPTSQVSLRELYTQFKSWCRDSGYQLPSMQTFAKGLVYLGYTKETGNIDGRRNVAYFSGLKLVGDRLESLMAAVEDRLGGAESGAESGAFDALFEE